MSTTTNSTVPPDFDPYTQAFRLLGPDGTPFSITVADLDYWRLYGVRLAINYGSQIGATSILLFMLLLLTKSEKRRSWIFILNALCLVTNTVRSILYSLFLTGNYFNPYAIFSGDYSRVTSSNRATTIAANTMTLIVVILVMMSLGMQVWVVCITTPKIQRIFIMSVTTIFALFAVGYRFALTVIGNALAMKDEGLENHTGLQKQTQIFITVAIWIYCLVFTFKLGDAIFQRRKLGMTQFGPMQIIFIMGCQTMIVPGTLPLSPCPSITQTLTYPSHIHDPPIPRPSPRTGYPNPNHRQHLPSALRNLGRRHNQRRPHRQQRSRRAS
jgi:pheromone alpha factor receptor